MSDDAGLPRPVEVLRDGQWYPGWLEALYKDKLGWRAYVRYEVAPGRTHVEWKEESEVRRVDT